MSLTYETANRLVEQGEFGQLCRLAEPYLVERLSLEPRLLVLLAHALVYAGEGRRALSLLADLNLESKATDLSKSRARLVLGLAHRSTGSMTKALGEFQRAVHAAQESGTAEEVAWAHLYFFRQMIDGHPVDLAPAMLPVVRAAVTKAGSPGTSAFLHMCVSVLEGHNGRLDEAARHCEMAGSLISLAQNAWLRCGNQLNHAAILLAGCRFSDAMRVLESLREEAARHGLNHECAQAEANLGHLYAMVGDRRALDTLARVARSPSTPRLAALSACEGMARAYLSQGLLEQCREVLDQLDMAGAEDEALASAYSVRWASITRARLYLAEGRAAAAIEHLRQVAERYRDGADVPFSATVSMITAQALATDGQAPHAARELIQADRLGATAFRELQGQFYDAAAATLSSGESELALLLRRRASEIEKEQGTAGAQKRSDAPPARIVATPEVMDARTAVNSLASFVDLAHNPKLLSRELASMIKSLGCSPHVTVVVTSGETTATPKDGVRSLSLGGLDRDEWHLECALPSDPATALVLTDLLRVGRAAVTLEQLKAVERNRAAVWPATNENDQGGALFLSDEMRQLAEMALRVATTDVPVLITGETGTGKEVLARLIHSNSQRSKRSFVPFNCTTVPKEMMDSQLFGHRRGAFTGAMESFQGVIRSARAGTLLLDEIGDLALESQPKFLRFLEAGEILPLGESIPIQVDVRVIAATNADLDRAVSDGRFREDLYYRLNIVHLKVPPLRERRTEIPSLARHYLNKYATQLQKGDLRLSEEAMEFLVLFRWPGNIRQLSNEMRRVAALAECGAVIVPEHLSPEIGRSNRIVPFVPTVEPNQVAVRLDQPMEIAVEQIERAMLRYAMTRYEGRVEVVAKALGLSRKGLYLKRQRYGIAAAEI